MMHVYYWAEQHGNISKEIARIVFQLSQQNVNSLPPQTCTQTDEPWQPSLPHRPALSRNALTWGILSEYCKQRKKKENNAKNNIKIILMQNKTIFTKRTCCWYSCTTATVKAGIHSYATLNHTQENPAFSVPAICFLFTLHITPET